VSNTEIKPDEFGEMIVGAPEPGTPGSQRYSCHKCHEDAWLSPSGQARVKRWRETKVLCLRCCVSLRRADCDVRTATLDEISKDLGSREEAERLKSAFDNLVNNQK
jgi:transposase-like protein